MTRILIIDDNDEVRKSIKNILNKEGYETLEASNGEDGISILKKQKVDLLLMDVVMPKKGGIESLFAINEIIPDLKKIFITGKIPQDSEAFKDLSYTYGVYDIIFKPFKKEELLSKIIECLDK
jgi:CheY-like chemotaxis protein